MDTLEIISSVRNITGLHTEVDLGTRELIRDINAAYLKSIIPDLYDHIRDKLYAETEFTDQTGETIVKPAIADVLIDVSREAIPCMEIPLWKKAQIGQMRGRILQYPDDDADHPFYIDEGVEIRLYPILATTDVIVSYRKKTPALIYGKGAVASSVLTLDQFASVIDDIYNGYEIALYTVSATEIILTGIYTISDYAGSTKAATLSTTPGDGTYEYALVPVVPDIFHPLIADAALIELAKSGKYETNITELKRDLMLDMEIIQTGYVRN